MGKCYNSIIINAPVETVWVKIKNFHDLSWAPCVVTDVEVVGDVDGNTPGAKRIINGLFHETLINLDGNLKTFSYTIDDGPGPVSKDSVSDYVGSVSLRAITESDTTFMEWESSYESPDDSAVGDFCNPIYMASLDALRNQY